MQHFTHASSDGRSTLAAYRTETAQPRALLQISHGMCEYILRYEQFANYLAQEGFLVFGHDHIGHGRSVASHADLGYTAHRGGADCMVEDVHALALRMKAEYPDLPLFLLGHSMGSFVARAVLARYPNTYTAAILMGTAGPGMPTAAGRLVARMIGAVRGERYRSPLLYRLSFAGYNKRCGKGCSSAAWLTRNEAVVNAYVQDPLCAFVFTTCAYHDLFTLLGRVSSRGWAPTIRKDLPLLLVSGAEDPVGGFGRGVEEVRRRLLDAGVTDVTLSLYPGMRHEILNELGYETVWSDLLTWMKKYIK